MADFISFTKDDYKFNWHHRLICEKADAFIHGEIKKLLVFAPPQHGKSEITTRRVPAMILGKDPKKKIAIVSYSKTLAEGFNRDIQRIIDSAEYHTLFPETYLASSNVVTDVRSAYLRNMTMFETVKHKGSVRTVGVDGTLTGFPVDVAIFDDLYKSREEALSPKRRNTIESFYDSVLIPRLHNDSQILGTFTRWSEDDIGGMLLRLENDWEVIEIPAIKEKAGAAYDPRAIGEALWPEKHSLERLDKIKKKNTAVWNSMYQQNPKPATEILILTNWDEVDEMPNRYPKFGGMDFGYSNDPTTIVQMEYHKGELWIDELLYKTKQTNGDIKKHFENFGIKRQRTWADSEDPRTINELRLLGLTGLIEAIKGPGSVARGINELQELKIHITRRSHNLKRELNNYQWVVIGGKPTNDPLENGNDHLIDAVRYGYAGYTQSPKIKI
jgi:hypothetical protein